MLLRAARFTAGHATLVGQEPAPCKRASMSTPGVVREDMCGWVLSQEGDKWSVKLDVRDLGGHVDTTLRGWSATLVACSRHPSLAKSSMRRLISKVPSHDAELEPNYTVLRITPLKTIMHTQNS